MSMFDASVAKPNEGSGFSVIEEGTYPAVCFMLVDIGTHSTSYNGEVKDKHQMLVGFELPTEKVMENGVEVSYTIFKRYNIVLNDAGTLVLYSTSGLYKDIISWRGQEFTDEEKKNFSVTKLIGAPCMIQITHSKSKDGSRTYANINGIMRLMKGLQKPVMTQTPIIFAMGESDPYDVAKLPVWIGNLVKDSPEFERELEKKQQTEEYKAQAAAAAAKPLGKIPDMPQAKAPTSAAVQPITPDEELPF